MLAGAVLLTGMDTASAQANARLADLSLEELGNVVVTSVSRQEEPLSDSAAAIFIISAADLRRAGARSLPEALRLAPNLQVAKVDARNYAITARGFNGVFENKLLVLIDGRSVYTPLFSGIFWDAQDVVIDDIERIEVISGPGATLWGANAVNGVINVITKRAGQTQGGLLDAAAGGHQRDGALRYGGRLDGGARWRAYGKSAAEDQSFGEDGRASATGWHREQAGFRLDWDLPATALSASGDAYRGRLEQAGTRDIHIGGANLAASARRQLDGGAEVLLQLVADHTERDQPNAFSERLDTLDLQLQHATAAGQVHQLVWGGGYRHARDRVDNGPAFGFLPGDLNLHWANLFIQDEIALLPTLKLTAGLKFEHDTYTGAEYLPTLRLAWKAHPGGMLWGGLTRAVRSPSRIDRDFHAPTQPLLVDGKPYYVIGGGPQFQSEVAKTAELGYRRQPQPDWGYSVTAFYSDYARLRTLEPQPAGAGAGAVFGNQGEGSVRGVELWGVWQPAPVWRLNAGLVVQDVRARLLPGSRDTSGDSGLAANDPSHHWQLRSALDLGAHWMLDLQLRHTGVLPKPAVPAYSELEAQLRWLPRPDLELALLGQNLLHARHVEFGGVGRSVFERAVLLKLSKRF